ncbi:MAG: DNA-processing protein DprA [Cyanobacteria bacterium]|nr:DNA-processing protein DprA [Cyanobacteriota bacterium]MDW8201826.1 DNA-processing protein DprA [Cyanobacteriota bacterium SKYGB_h_bin112]
MDDRAYWLAWAQVPGIGATLVKRIQQRFGSLQAGWSASLSDLMTVEGIGPQISEAILATRNSLEPYAFLEQHQQKNPCFWTPADPDYPRLLLETPSYPLVLYYRGHVVPEENQGRTNLVAIVGTRNPSDYGKRWTQRLTTALVQHGFVVVSGLAEGIDTEAHRTCVSRGSRTIAVVGSGIDVVYPVSNRQLCDDILVKGLVVSEYPRGTKPDRLHFPQRNRIIAGLCRAVLITEAPARSGALITASIANDYGRDVYVLPGALDNPRSYGCLELINQGAQLILGERHLLELLGTLPALDNSSAPETPISPRSESTLPPDLDPSLAKVLATISSDSVSFDYIVQHVEMPANVVSSALIQLQLMNLITELPGMRYQRH